MSPRPSRPSVALVLGLLTLLTAAPARAERIEVASKPVPLNPTDLNQDKVGLLTYRGGLALTSSHPRFGGLSALRLSEDGRTDHVRLRRGVLVHRPPRPRPARPPRRASRTPSSGRSSDLDGQPLLEKDAADAESLVRMPDGSMIVGLRAPASALALPGHERAARRKADAW